MRLPGPTDFSSTDLSVLQQQLAHWRSRQSGRGRLPLQAWQSAAVLARGLGLSHVSRRLGLSYSKLRRLLSSADPDCSRPLGRTGQNSFVEVAWPPVGDWTQPPAYRAEMVEGTAMKLTFHLGGDLRAVLALAEAFWSRPA